MLSARQTSVFLHPSRGLSHPRTAPLCVLRPVTASLVLPHITAHTAQVAGYILRRSPTIDPRTEEISFPIKTSFASNAYKDVYVFEFSRVLALSSQKYPDLKNAWHELSTRGGTVEGLMRVHKHDGIGENDSI